MEQAVQIDGKRQYPARLSILPVTNEAVKGDEIDNRSRTRWLRGGRQPAIIVTNEAGELIYTVHRGIHPEPHS